MSSDRRRITDITATFLYIKNDSRDRGFIVGQIEVVKDPAGKLSTGDQVSMLLSVDPTRVPEENETYAFRGTHEVFNGRPNFKAREFTTSEPIGRAAIVKYLLKVGKGNGIGRVKAERLFDTYGNEVLNEIEDPKKLDGFVNTSEARIISTELKRTKKQREVEVKLYDLLCSRKFPTKTVARCIESFGLRAPEIIQQNPFLLLRFPGCGIKLCDQLWLDMGHDPKSYKRAVHIGRHELSSNQDGSTWLKPIRMKSAMPSSLPIETKKKAIGRAVQVGLVSKFRDREQNWYLADSIRSENEWNCAIRIAELSQPSSKWEEILQHLSKSDCSDHQKEKAAEALQNNIAALTGSPGTGKTFLAARIVKAWQELFGRKILCLAPTGKASVRLAESFEGNGVSCRTSTYHSALCQIEVETEPHSVARNQFDADLVLIDETSMIPTDMFRIILQCLPHGCHLLLIGDPNQLPPIKHGAPLRDLIESGLPYGELTEIRRNSGNIVRSCHSVKDGGALISSDSYEKTSGENLVLSGCKNEEINKRAELIIRDLQQNHDADPIWDCQIIVATNKLRQDINKRFQQILNPAPPVERSIFRDGDKVINLENNNYENCIPIDNHGKVEWKRVSDSSEYVANGEIGCVHKSYADKLIVKIEGKNGYLLIPRKQTEKDSGCEFDLAYACTCHKLQGSSARFVIVAINDKEGKKLYSREWIYTAISRAEDACYIIGRIQIINRMINRVVLSERKTFLAERIRSRLKFHRLPEQSKSLEAQEEFGRMIEV